MAFCKLTREWDNVSVYVNPAQVVALTPGEPTGTRIVTAANAESGPHAVTVTEQIDTVANMLNGNYPIPAR